MSIKNCLGAVDCFSNFLDTLLFIWGIITEHFSGHFEFITAFVVSEENKTKECNQKTKETTQIWDKIVYFPVCSFNFNLLIRLPEVEVSIAAIFRRKNKAFFFISINENTSLFDFSLYWEQTFISLNFILTDINIGINGKFSIQHVIIFIFKIVWDWLFQCWIYQFVDKIVIDTEWRISVTKFINLLLTCTICLTLSCVDANICKFAARPFSREFYSKIVWQAGELEQLLFVV